MTEGGYSGVQSFPLGSSGNVKPTTSITGHATGLDATTAAVIDPVSGTLYIASAGNQEIAEYPYGATGNVAPSAVDRGRGDRALLSGGARARQLRPAVRRQPRGRTASPSTPPGATGNAKPVATITGADTGLVGPSGLTFDRAGHLWVANSGANSLTEYAAAPRRRHAAGDDQRSLHRAERAAGADARRRRQPARRQRARQLADRIQDQRQRRHRAAAHDHRPVSYPTGSTSTHRATSTSPTDSRGVNEYAPDASGAATPIATISGPATGISGPSGVAVAPPLIVRTRRLPAARVGRRTTARGCAPTSAPPRTGGR